jgi:hypothetical protein
VIHVSLFPAGIGVRISVLDPILLMGMTVEIMMIMTAYQFALEHPKHGMLRRPAMD